MVGTKDRTVLALLAMFVGTVFLFVGTVGCGGDDDGDGSGSPEFDSSVSESKSLSDLSESERTTVCEDFESWWSSTAPSTSEACTYSAHVSVKAQEPGSDDEAQEMCSNSKSTCEEQSSDGTDMSSCDEAEATDCSVTVGEFEECIQDYFGGYAEAVRELPACSDVSTSWYADWDSSSVWSQAESCAAIREECPEFLGGSAGGSSGGGGSAETSGGGY